MKNIYRFFFLMIILCISSLAISAQVTEKSDTLWVNETWSDTIKVTGNVFIADDVILTIDPGTYVEFQGYYFMYVHGTILAEGSETDSIVFTVKDNLGWSNPDVTDGSWNGFLFYNGAGWGGAAGAMNDNDTSHFDYCRIEYTKAGSFSEFCWSAIEIHQFSRLIISNSEFHHNYTHYRGGAVFFNSDSDIKIFNSHFHHNIAQDRGGAIHVNNSSPVIWGNIFEYNRTTSTDWPEGRGGAIDILAMNPNIKNNIFRYNSAVAGSGICMLNSFALIENNTIAYNTGYNVLPDLRSIGGGIYMDETSNPKIINNKIANNNAREAGGLFAHQSTPLILNNLIANNTGVERAGAMIFSESEAAVISNTITYNESPEGGTMQIFNSEVAIVNNIIWNNDAGNDIHLQDEFAYADLANNIIQYGNATLWGAGDYDAVNTTNTNPEFDNVAVDIGSGEDGLDVIWSVPSSSPAVNKGRTDLGNIKLPKLDIQGNDRIHHTFIDIGAYEVHVQSIDVDDTIKVNTTWVADTVYINSDVTVNDNVILAVLPGTQVVFTDTFHLKVNGTLIAKGQEDNMIHFTKTDTANYYKYMWPVGGWQGIIFDNSYDGMINAMADNVKSIIQYCHFSFVKIPMKNGDGGAIQIRYYDKVEIMDCIFENNRAWNSGGVICLDRSDIEILRCQFTGNSGGNGGAVYSYSSDINIKSCTFTDNFSFDEGGAVKIVNGEAEVRDNLFSYNTALADGGAIMLRQVVAEIRNNFFVNDSAGNRGGAIAAYFENCKIINNVIVNNQAGGPGGGIHLRHIDDAITINNTICNNLAQWGGGMFTLFVNHKAFNDILYGNDCHATGRQYGLYSSTSLIEFNNCNIEGGVGEMDVFIGDEFNVTVNELIDSLPTFIRPSDGPGTDFDGATAKWHYRSVSPCINNGTLNGIVQLIGIIDIAGNPRVHDSIIDIGAFESQYGLPEITIQPFNQVVCDDDTVVLHCKARYFSYYQWQKDGMDIEGATDQMLIINGVNPDQVGNYQCIVSNAFGSVESNKMYLGVESPPEILLQPVTTWGIEGTRTILSTQATGTPPLNFQWYKNGEVLGFKKYPDLWINNTKVASEAMFHCIIANGCGVVSTDTVQLYLAPQICMVTVDSAENHNLVVWEKKSTAPIESYNIYRESIVRGFYDSIGNVSADDLSVYTDTEVNPAAQSYLYKITAVDFDGNESDIELCTPHKTLHLLTSENPEFNQIQCDWDPYYGFPYGTFSIYRGTAEGVLDSIHSMSSSSNQWLDTEAEPNVDYFYRVVVRREELCVPTGNKKAGAGPYSHSLSNQDDNRLQVSAIEDAKTDEGLIIYPNPFSDFTILQFPNPDKSEYFLFIRDLSGKLIYSQGKITGEEIILRRDNLKAGYYSVEVTGPRIYRSKIIIE